MAIPDILIKLQAELDQGIATEAQVVYLLAGIRKLMEQEDTQDVYPYLNFHCNWVLHSSLDRGLTKAILANFNQAHIELAAGLDLHDLPQPLRGELDDISAMWKFQEELFRFLEDHNLSNASIRTFPDWSRFLQLYMDVIKDCPLVMKSNDKDSRIAKVTASFVKAVRFEAGQYLYKISWRITDKDGSEGEIYIMNSFDIKDSKAG